MSAKRTSKPFCPNCGDQKQVKKHTDYFDFWKWKCTVCDIAFNYSKLSESKTPYGLGIDPSTIHVIDPSKLSDYRILNPARKIFFEQHAGKIRIAADVKSFKSLLDSPEIQSLLPFDNTKGTHLGNLDLDSGKLNMDKGSIDL